MGRLYKIACRKCKREWECRTGCGLMHGRLEFAGQAFPKETREAIYADISERDLALFDFGYRMADCCHCGNVVSVPVLNLLGRERLFVGSCPECGGVIQQDELWTEQLGEGQGEPLEVRTEEQPSGREDCPHVCPACREGALSCQMTGVWD